jgi:hypothetical protein
MTLEEFAKLPVPVRDLLCMAMLRRITARHMIAFSWVEVEPGIPVRMHATATSHEAANADPDSDEHDVHEFGNTLFDVVFLIAKRLGLEPPDIAVIPVDEITEYVNRGALN